MKHSPCNSELSEDIITAVICDFVSVMQSIQLAVLYIVNHVVFEAAGGETPLSFCLQRNSSIKKEVDEMPRMSEQMLPCTCCV